MFATRVRMMIPLVVLMLAALACNLGAPPPSVTTTPGSATPGTQIALSDVPEVEIRSPADNTEVIINTEVQVYVRAVDRQGVTRVEMRVDNQIVDTAASPEATGTPTMDSILSWTPSSAGSHTIQVVAFRGTTRGNPKSITLIVRETPGQVTRPAGSPAFLTASPTNDPTCRVRADVNLNMRSGPGLNYDVVGSLPVGTTVPATGSNADRSWWQVNVQGVLAWVSASFSTQLGICSNVLVVPIPASPTVRPGATPIAVLPTFTFLPTIIPPTPSSTFPIVVLPTLTSTTRPTQGSGQPSIGDLTSTAIYATQTAIAAPPTLAPPPTNTATIAPGVTITVGPTNTATLTPTVTSTPVLPNLVINSVALSSTTIVLDPVQKLATVPFSIKVANTGDAPAPVFQVAVDSLDGRVTSPPLTQVLNAKAEIDIPLNVTFTEKSLGQQRISIIVDSGNVVAESNEADNVAFRDITVVVATVAGATTVVPTTQAPPTAITQPATVPPTTPAPTTPAPTTAVPTTAVPTTAVATTAVPTTAVPTTQPATQPAVITATTAPQTPVATQAPTEPPTVQPTVQTLEPTTVPPTVPATQPATPPPTTAVAAAPTNTPTLCPQPTPELLQVEPVTSPTTEFSQVVVVRIGNGDQVTITTESGTFQAVGDFSVNQPAQIMVTLLPNTTHNLQVTARVKATTGPGGCAYASYTLNANTDRNGQPLVIVQQAPTAIPPTPVPPTETPVPPTETPVPPTPVPPTETPIPPTETPVPPTETPVPPTPVPPTETPVPPTETPVPPTAVPTTQAPPPGVDLLNVPISNLNDGGVQNQIRQIHNNGKQQGVVVGDFMLVGDTTLAGIGGVDDQNANLDQLKPQLDPIIQLFDPGIKGIGRPTARGNFTSANILNPASGANECQGKAPLICALDAKPATVFINVGRNDIAANLPLDQFRANLANAVNAAAGRGVIPVLVTITGAADPANEPKVAQYNNVIYEVAQATNSPLFNIYALRKENPALISSANGDLTNSPNNVIDFSQAGLQFGTNVAALRQLEFLNALKSTVPLG
jgi:hypothetical protein